MKFSIIIPLYNKAGHISESISSVLTQDFKDFELIVVNDGSTDKSTEVVKGISHPKLRLIQKENGGTATARNRGIKEARGEYICFLDADDFWYSEFLSSVNLLAAKYPDAGMYGTAYKFLKKGRLYHPGYYGLPDEEKFLVPNYFQSVLMGEQVITASSVCIPKKVFEELGLFNESIRHTEDQEMWNRIALHYPIAFFNKVLAVYRQDAQNMKTRRVPKHEIEYAVCLQQLLDENKIPDRHIMDAKKIIAANLIGVASLNLLAGDRETARKFLHDPRTDNFPERKQAWQKVINWPVSLIRILYALRNFLKNRR